MSNKFLRKKSWKKGLIGETKMWRLLKAEIAYNTQAFLFILLTSFLGFLGIHFWPVISRQTLANLNAGYVYLSLTYSYFVMAVLVTSWTKEKRPRQFVCLPVSVRQIGLAHGLTHLIYWSLILTIFFVWVWISNYFNLDSSVFLALGVLTGVNWLVFSIIVFSSRFRDSVAMGVIQSPSSALLWMIIGIGSTLIVLSLPRLRSYV